jgi:hypothetical protein
VAPGTSPPGAVIPARGDDRSRRLRAACAAALDRLAGTEARGVDPDIFPELGEALFWLAALQDAKDRPKDALLLGLRWARNRITHGALVSAAPTEWNCGSEPGRAVTGRAGLGTSSGHVFLPRDQVPLGQGERRIRDQEQGYDSEVAGRQVLPLLRSALGSLHK